ncbi:hypothetical protein TrST_g3923 [Triparma strigata]|uniref:NAD(P)-binding protein n=1 Tax=Triparma strigata TaxID=1606541 RepID=A0A9W7BIF0_9STRA|nr:hypothetical protein TrST_g3923 [Triparma strigata]
MPLTYLITGCSSGLGLELARQLTARGEKVYATVRKLTSSFDNVDYISKVGGDLTIIENVDVAVDDCKTVLSSALAGIQIDVLINNAGGINGTRELQGMAIMGEQKLESITSDRMLAAFQLNTLGPLRVTQAVLPNMKSGGKIAIISTGMGSIADNGSGGIYAYRCSKSAVNMLAKNLACDLKKDGIAVVAVNPGMVTTSFGPGAAALGSMGAQAIGDSSNGPVASLIKCFDELNLESTGRFMTTVSGGKTSDPIPFPAGW